MRKTITENGIEYRLTGDYYLPNLAVSEESEIGYWGELCRNFLREHHEGIYTGITEEMKVRDPIEWVRPMNNIQSRAIEMILNELVYT